MQFLSSNNLSKQIEYEIHALHDITNETNEAINALVRERMNSKECKNKVDSIESITSSSSKSIVLNSVRKIFSSPSFTATHDIKINSNLTIKLPYKLNSFQTKLVQFISSRLYSDVNNKYFTHMIQTIVTHAFIYFPNNPEIYLMHCIKQIDSNKDSFVSSYVKQVTNQIDTEHKIWTNIFMFFATIVVLIGFVLLISKTKVFNKVSKDLKKKLNKKKNKK